MSKIEYNPRKRRHIDFLYTIIMELHTDIFQASFALVQNNKVYDSPVFRKDLKTKIELYKKYSKRLKLIEL